MTKITMTKEARLRKINEIIEESEKLVEAKLYSPGKETKTVKVKQGLNKSKIRMVYPENQLEYAQLSVEELRALRKLTELQIANKRPIGVQGLMAETIVGIGIIGGISYVAKEIIEYLKELKHIEALLKMHDKGSTVEYSTSEENNMNTRTGRRKSKKDFGKWGRKQSRSIKATPGKKDAE